MINLLKGRVALPGIVVGLGLLSVSPVLAAGPQYFYGTDANASNASQLVNSKAAQTNFLAAAGAVSTYDFESVNVGASGSLNTVNGWNAGDFNISFTGTSAAHIYNEPIESEQPGNSSLTNGFNTTSGGSQYMFIEPTQGQNASTTFTFNKSVDAFGLYITGLGNNNLVLNATFNDGQQQQFTVTGTPGVGGAEYFGMLDKGANISSISFTEPANSNTRDRYSIDDISYQSSATPEAGTLAILAVAMGGMLLFSSRRKRVIA